MIEDSQATAYSDVIPDEHTSGQTATCRQIFARMLDRDEVQVLCNWIEWRHQPTGSCLQQYRTHIKHL